MKRLDRSQELGQATRFSLLYLLIERPPWGHRKLNQAPGPPTQDVVWVTGLESKPITRVKLGNIDSDAFWRGVVAVLAPPTTKGCSGVAFGIGAGRSGLG